MPSMTIWLRDVEVSYPYMHMGDANTVNINIGFTSCGTGGDQIKETHDFIDMLMDAFSNNQGKISMSIMELKNETNERKPETVRAEMSDLQ